MALLRSTCRGGPAGGGTMSRSACSNRCSGLSTANVVRLDDFPRLLVFHDREALLSMFGQLALNGDQRVEHVVTVELLRRLRFELDRDAHGVAALRVHGVVADDVVDCFWGQV